MDLTTISDIDKLKSLAFDQIQAIEQAQANLRAIQTRIQQVTQSTPEAIPNADGDKLVEEPAAT